MDAKNVTAAKPNKAGAVFNAVLNSTLPTDVITALDKAFVSLGFISENGITNSNSPTCTDVKAWGGDIVLSTQTEKKDEWKFTLIEANNVNVLKAIYGPNNVTGTLEEGIKVVTNSEEVEATCWVIDTILKNGTKKRVVIPNGKITAIGDVVYKANEPIGYSITIHAIPDATGATHYEYIKNSTTAGA